MSLTYVSCIVSNLFHHKYNDKDFSKGNKKKFPRETSVLAKPVAPRNQRPRETNGPAKPAPRGPLSPQCRSNLIHFGIFWK